MDFASRSFACRAATPGTARDRTLRSSPPHSSMRRPSRSPASTVEKAPVHSMLARAARLAREHRGAGAVAEDARAHQHAGIVVDVERGAAHLDAHRQHVFMPPGRDQRIRGAQVGQRGAAALADQVQREDVGAQAEPLGDVAGQSRAEVAGAGADEDRVDAAWRDAGALERLDGGFRGERWRMLREALVQDVGLDGERIVERIEREVAGADAAFTQQHALQQDSPRGRQRGKARRRAQGIPALALAVTRVGHCGTDTGQIHGASFAKNAP